MMRIMESGFSTQEGNCTIGNWFLETITALLNSEYVGGGHFYDFFILVLTILCCLFSPFTGMLSL